MRAVRILTGAGIIAVVAAAGLVFGFTFVLMNAHHSEKYPGDAGVSVGRGAVAAAGAIGAGGGKPAVVEIVNRIGVKGWGSGPAMRWLDSWTASEMRPVDNCSGRASRCIILKAGKVSGSAVGWSRGNVITVDTGKAKRRGYTAADRKLLLVHELGHQFGLKHSGGRNIMNPYEGRWKLALTGGQKRALGKR